MSIPADAIVQVNPGVIGGGGSSLILNGVLLTADTAVPIGSVQPFANGDAVGSFFGLASLEKTLADKYFAGFDNSTAKPGNLLIAQYATDDVAGYLRGGPISSLSLAALQALSGVLTVVVDGTSKTSGTINLSAATSFSNAAALIQAGFSALGGTVSYDSVRGAFVITSASKGAGAVVTGSIGTTTLTVTAIASGKLGIGSVLSGTGVTAGTTITALGTGTGGVGTYTVGTSQTAAQTTITGAPSTVGYASGSLAAGLLMTQATGAVKSAGVLAYTPAIGMAAVVAATLNWATFMTTFEPTTADKLLFADWILTKNKRYAYVAWDTDVLATQSGNTTGFGPQLLAREQDGVIPISGDVNVANLAGVTLTSLLQKQAAFVMGMIASIDFTRTEGRITLAFKGQSGQVAAVADETIGNNLIANGYNFYGSYATANDQFTFFYPGSTPGAYLFADEYVNQVWLNAQLQLALITLMTTINSMPYNAKGYNLVDAACLDPILAALNFGAIREGVPLSAQQIATVNTQAGVQIDTILSTRGWFLQILAATAQVRAARGSPPISLWYMDGGSIQNIRMASIAVQ